MRNSTRRPVRSCWTWGAKHSTRARIRSRDRRSRTWRTSRGWIPTLRQSRRGRADARRWRVRSPRELPRTRFSPKRPSRSLSDSTQRSRNWWGRGRTPRSISLIRSSRVSSSTHSNRRSIRVHANVSFRPHPQRSLPSLARQTARRTDHRRRHRPRESRRRPRREDGELRQECQGRVYEEAHGRGAVEVNADHLPQARDPRARGPCREEERARLLDTRGADRKGIKRQPASDAARAGLPLVLPARVAPDWRRAGVSAVLVGAAPDHGRDGPRTRVHRTGDAVAVQSAEARPRDGA